MLSEVLISDWSVKRIVFVWKMWRIRRGLVGGLVEKERIGEDVDENCGEIALRFMVKIIRLWDGVGC